MSNSLILVDDEWVEKYLKQILACLWEAAVKSVPRTSQTVDEFVVCIGPLNQIWPLPQIDKIYEIEYGSVWSYLRQGLSMLDNHSLESTWRANKISAKEWIVLIFIESWTTFFVVGLLDISFQLLNDYRSNPSDRIIQHQTIIKLSIKLYFIKYTFS